jgi:hypothetical protein
MSGTAITKSLLGANAALVAQVPATRIFVGDVPLNTTLPAISVKRISGTSYLPVAMNLTTTFQTQRIQVTLLTKTAAQDAIWALIRPALPNTRGTVSTFAVDSILPDIEGPDMFDQVALIYQQSTDYMVKFAR